MVQKCIQNLDNIEKREHQKPYVVGFMQTYLWTSKHRRSFCLCKEIQQTFRMNEIFAEVNHSLFCTITEILRSWSLLRSLDNRRELVTMGLTFSKEWRLKNHSWTTAGPKFLGGRCGHGTLFYYIYMNIYTFIIYFIRVDFRFVL